MPVEEWLPSPNFGSRNGRRIIAIINHSTSGGFPGCLSWLQNPISKSSAHYLVTRSGRIIQLVKEGNSAYHAGIRNQTHWSLYDGTNPNSYTIGIEHEGFDGSLTEEQYQATLFLHKELTSKYLIPIDSEHIIGHYRIDSVNRPNCPGPGFPWERLFNDLKGVVSVTEEVKPAKGPIAPDDVYLSVRVQEKYADELIKTIRKLGYATERLELA